MRFSGRKNRHLVQLLWLLPIGLFCQPAAQFQVQAQAQAQVQAQTQTSERLTLQASFANNALPLKLNVLVGQTRVVDFDQPYERVSVSDNKIAEVVPVSEKQCLINGLGFGQVNVVAWAKRPTAEAA